MKKNYKTLIILFSAINVFAQNNVIDKTSNNLTLDGNVEFIDKNLIQAESFYRKAFDLTGTPLRIELKNSSNPYDVKAEVKSKKTGLVTRRRRIDEIRKKRDERKNK